MIRSELDGPRWAAGGLLPQMPGRERYRVAGGGATVIALATGDRIDITDVEGGQRCELAVFSPTGDEDSAALGAASDSQLGVLGIGPAGNEGEAHAAIAALLARGIDPRGAPALQLFRGDGPAAAKESFTAQRDIVCIVGAPGGRMRVDAQDPPTDLELIVQRARVTEAPELPLPAPLGDMRLDMRLERATARAYEVKAGEYIQVIDVAGQQCSDFLAFRSDALQHGVEKGLDATATRYVMGSAYPAPGLYSKFYDQDSKALIEVVRDTVGRHDTFGLACTSKYYEDMGYFGHANCSDNFTAELDPYTIAARKGWQAINFFYNTRIDDNNVLYFDEPWSRPGDYVLLRALTDLVCLTSACPDDIDPANAWNPTEIHVRVYPAKSSFSMGIARRMTPDAEAKLTRETGFHPRTASLTRKFAEYNGHWLPTEFTDYGAIKEYYACREGAVVMDLSPLRKFEVLGPDAEALMQATLTRDVRRIAVGRVSYTSMCNESGGLLDDGTLFRLGADNFRWIGGNDTDGIWLREQAEKRRLKAWVKSSSEQLHNIAVQGPRSRDILGEVVWTAPTQPSIEELKWFRFSVGRVAVPDGTPVLVSRTGYTGELGYEVWCHPDDAVAVWDAIWEAGAPHDLTPLGLDALDILRIESGLIFPGYEYDDQVDPFEAGIGFTVDLDSTDDDFVGRAALVERKAHPQRRLVGLELEGNETGGHGDGVYVGRSQVGVITSGTRSPILRKNIALCRLATEHASVGTEVEIGKLDGHQKRIAAAVVPFPFYDPEKKRPRS